MGGAAFVQVTNLTNLLNALVVKQVFDEAAAVAAAKGELVNRNVATGKSVMECMQSLEADLAEIGIHNLDILRKRDQPDDVVSDEELLFLLHRHHIDPQVLRAALDCKYKDTGHVMFAAGPAKHCLDDKNKWCIPVYQFASASRGAEQYIVGFGCCTE